MCAFDQAGSDGQAVADGGGVVELVGSVFKVAQGGAGGGVGFGCFGCFELGAQGVQNGLWSPGLERVAVVVDGLFVAGPDGGEVVADVMQIEQVTTLRAKAFGASSIF